MEDPIKLTSKQERFIEEYLIDFNGKQAAIRAGYSEQTASNIASENLTKPYLIDEINKRKALLAQKCEITKDEILADLKMIKDAQKKSKNPQHAMKSIEILNKMLGYYEAERIKHEGGITINYIKPTRNEEDTE